MRSSAPASLGVFAINGEGSCFCSTVTGLLGRTALGAKKKIKSRSSLNLKKENIKVPQQLLHLIGLAMADAPNSPRGDRLTALLVMAEIMISRTDDEKGNWDWKSRSEVLEVIALLASVDRSIQGARHPITAPTSSRPESTASEVKISPTIPWVAEEGHTTDALTIVERGRLFSVWSGKRRRLREG